MLRIKQELAERVGFATALLEPASTGAKSLVLKGPRISPLNFSCLNGIRHGSEKPHLGSPDGSRTIARVAEASYQTRDTSGILWLEITNLDPDQAVDIETSLTGITAKSAKGETLTAPKVDSVNTLAAPNTVIPKPVFKKVVGGKLTLKLEPKSVTVLSLEQ